ncbi:MAG: [Fe-Fe] hydrogenase large subunit C-terminal domain-containing protein [Bacteroidota bacterium]
MEFQIEVNNQSIRVKEGETLLTALRNNGFRIPTLCHMNRFSPTGACRLCAVEVEGERDLVTSCAHVVKKGMKVKTNSQRVIHARKTLVELLLSNHPDDCLYCQRNGHCELQWLAEEMNVKERRFFGKKNAYKPDYSSVSVARDPAKCVLCSRCVRMCEEVQLVTAIDFISRGNQTKVNSAFNKGLNVSSCISCGQCIQVCPTAALMEISHLDRVQAALSKKKQQVIFFISPSVTASVAETAGLKPKQDAGKMVASSLRKCGASRVFDLGVASDINVVEEATQLLEHLTDNADKPMPLLSSCCPSWVRYVEEFRPDSLSNLAGTKSPQHVMGSLLKTWYAEQEEISAEDIYTVAVMPCVAKKYEASREENTDKGISQVDAVLTVGEYFRLIRAFGLDLHHMEETDMDEPFRVSSAAAWKMGYAGGKAEAVAREVFRMLADPKKDTFKFNLPKNAATKRETKIKIGDRQIGFAWVSSIVEAEQFLHELEEEHRDDIHYVEVMACLGGCAGGGGQPVSRGFEPAKARKRFCMNMEKANPYSTAGDNPGLSVLYHEGSLLPGNTTLQDWITPRFQVKTYY